MALCPDPAGGPIHKQITPGRQWSPGPSTAWDLGRLPNQFKDVGLVVWIILPPEAGEAGRDGMANATFSILAGYALARPELALRVLAHRDAPNVADALEFTETFKTNAELRQKLAAIQQQWSDGTLK